MYLTNNKKDECSGCTACMNICPKQAIKMITDDEGFKYPIIDKNKCIDCYACEKICPNIKKNKENSIQATYGVKHKNTEERMTSRSGGIFVALSDYILDLDGVIYGAKLNEDFSVSHSRAENRNQRNQFKGSKYIQSDMNNVIEKIKEDLENGRKVLFSGTACQVAAVKSCISKEKQKNLYTCDLICHGVPSKRVFDDYLRYIEKKSGKRIKEFNFRDKTFGWSSHYETFIFEDNTKLTTQHFRNLFYGHYILRPACYKCNFANTNRPGDITIADFWGIENISPDFMDEIGVSLAIINNEKGKELFEHSKGNLDVIQCDIDKCIKATYTLNQPTPEPQNRSKFWNEYENNEFEYIIEQYAK